MHMLDLFILIYGAVVYLKLIINALCSIVVMILSSYLISSTPSQCVCINVIAIGCIIVSILSLAYSIFTWYVDNQYKVLELPRISILSWAIYSTIAYSTKTNICLNTTSCQTHFMSFIPIIIVFT